MKFRRKRVLTRLRAVALDDEKTIPFIEHRFFFVWRRICPVHNDHHAAIKDAYDALRKYEAAQRRIEETRSDVKNARELIAKGSDGKSKPFFQVRYEVEPDLPNLEKDLKGLIRKLFGSANEGRPDIRKRKKAVDRKVAGKTTSIRPEGAPMPQQVEFGVFNADEDSPSHFTWKNKDAQQNQQSKKRRGNQGNQNQNQQNQNQQNKE